MTDEAQAPHECRGVDDPFLVWVRGVDYVSQWAEADSAITTFYRALDAAGVKADDVHFVASTNDDGAAVVRGCSSAASLRELARLIRLGAGLPAEEAR